MAEPGDGLRAVRWSAATGALASLGSVAAWSCCLPLAAGAAGGFAALAGRWFWPARPWLLALAAGALAFGFWRAYRPAPCPPGGTCTSPSSRRRARLLLWGSLVLGLAALTLPWWSLRLLLARD